MVTDIEHPPFSKSLDLPLHNNLSSYYCKGLTDFHVDLYQSYLFRFSSKRKPKEKKRKHVQKTHSKILEEVIPRYFSM